MQVEFQPIRRLMEVSIEVMANQLIDKGIRPSYQRVKVLDYLYQKGGHPTVEEIYCALSPDIPSLSKVTIYNTLHTFVKAGLVRMVDIDETEMHYDITLTNHGHFRCDSCGEIINFSVNMDRVSIDGLDQFEITEKNVYFKGLCPNCRSQLLSTYPEIIPVGVVGSASQPQQHPEDNFRKNRQEKE
jgi:Fur family transcriptional regulator, peroxide stress response regulator